MLTAWHAATAPAGLDLPELPDLMAIADHGMVVESDSLVARRWQPTLDYLLKQAMFGVAWSAITLDPPLQTPLDLPEEPTPDPAQEALAQENPAQEIPAQEAPAEGVLVDADPVGANLLAAPPAEVDPVENDPVDTEVAAAPASEQPTSGQSDSAHARSASAHSDDENSAALEPSLSRSDLRAAQGEAAHPNGAGLANSVGQGSPAVRGSNDPRFAALLAWRAEAIADGRLPTGAATDAALGHLARSNVSEPRDVARRATNLADFADEIVEVLVGAGAVGAAATANASGSGRKDTVPVDRPPAGAESSESASPAPAASDRSAPRDPHDAGPNGVGMSAPKAPLDELEAQVQDLVLGQLATTHSLALQPSSGRIDLETGGDGARLAWAGRGGDAVTIYRLVLGDGERPLQPEDGETLVLTSHPRTEVPRAGGLSVLSYLQVWAYAGDSLDEAVAAQPDLIAERSIVTSVTDVQFSAEPGWVTLSWSAPEGASSVRVYRYVGERGPKHDSPANLVGGEGTNLIGISDAPPTTVPTLVYRAVVAVGTGDATQLSEPVDTVVTMPTRLEPVTDLKVVLVTPVQGNQAGQVDLQFTRPSVGKVWIYRLTEPLVGGVAGRQIAIHALPSAGLTDERRRHGRLGSPDEDGHVTMEGLQLPPGEPLLTFVPVTVLGEDAAVGTPARHVGIGIPGDPRLRDRVHEQVITFGWPAGATEVHLFPINPGDDESEVVQGRPAAQIDEIQYERDGGWRLPLGGIHQPQDFLLVGIKGAQHRGSPARVSYDPLLVLEYGIATGKTKAMFGQQRTTVAFWRCSGEAMGRPPFMVVHHPTRLPLTPTDGTPMPLVPDSTPDLPPSAEARPAMTATNAAEAEKFRIASPIPPGYLRAFLSSSVPAEVRTRVALIDPPVQQLRIRT